MTTSKCPSPAERREGALKIRDAARSTLDLSDLSRQQIESAFDLYEEDHIAAIEAELAEKTKVLEQIANPLLEGSADLLRDEARLALKGRVPRKPSAADIAHAERHFARHIETRE